MVSAKTTFLNYFFYYLFIFLLPFGVWQLKRNNLEPPEIAVFLFCSLKINIVQKMRI